MYIKRYSIAALLLIFAVGWFVFGFVSKQSIHIEFFGIVLPSLPVAVWVALAMLLLFAATLLHMVFYAAVGSIRLRKYERDYAKLLEAIAEAFLNKPNRSHSYKTSRYSLLGEIVDHVKMVPDTQLELDHTKLSEIVEVLRQIDSGENVELKRFNLDASNPLAIRNQLNRLHAGELEPEAVLAKAERYDKTLCTAAYELLAETGPLHTIEKYRQQMSFTALMLILERINADENTLSVPNATVVDFVSRIEGLRPLDYLYLSTVIAGHMLPEQRIGVMETLSDRDEKALDGYLFTLFDLEMIDKARELLQMTGAGEYILFRAFAELKACNRHYDIKIFAKMMLLNYEPRA